MAESYLNLKVIEASLYAAPRVEALASSILDLVLVRCERQGVRFDLQVYTGQGCGAVWCEHHRLLPRGQGRTVVRDRADVTLIPLVLAGPELSLFVYGAMLVPKDEWSDISEHMLMLRHESPMVPHIAANELVAKAIGGYKPEAIICWPGDDVDKLVGALGIDVEVRDPEPVQPTPDELAEAEKRQVAFKARLEAVIAKRGGRR
jgi:hypothetical protein